MLLACPSEVLQSKKIFLKQSSYLLLAVPLILAAFTHLWNALGFPAIQADEYKYVRRALHVLNGLGPQDPASRFDHGQIQPGLTSAYDHPYFGQLFLAGMFKIIGYPSSLNPTASSDLHSIEMLYLVPRLLMGILSIVDTFLIFKIAKRLYNDEVVAFVASILFAVMPITWMLRWILLDSIQLPFLLSSILFAVYYSTDAAGYLNNGITNKDDNENRKNKNYKHLAMLLLSGIFLGLAIFTKIPVFTMIPLVGYFIFNFSSSNMRRSWKNLGLWFIPVILIPLIWPLYAISSGQVGEWMTGVFYQAAQRNTTAGRTVFDALNIFFQIDPVLLSIGIAGLVFGIIKRDYFVILWIVPYFIFLYLIGWVVRFHLILIIPVLCISGAILIVDLLNKINSAKKKKKDGEDNNNASKSNGNNKGIIRPKLQFVVISAIAIFGIVMTSIMISTNNASTQQLEAAAFIVKKVLDSNNYKIRVNNNDNYTTDDHSTTTIISGPAHSWLFKYVFGMEHVFSDFRDSSMPIKTKKIILVVDSIYRYELRKVEPEDEKQIELLKNIYKNTKTIAFFKNTAVLNNKQQLPYENYYPYTGIKEGLSSASGIEIRTNY